MEVLSRAERLDQQGVLGEVRHDPHLDLAVVGRQQRLVARAHHETLADPATCLGPDGDVLEVGVGAGQAPGRSDDLVVRRVDPTVGRDGLEQPLHRLAQPDDVAVAQQVLEERVLGLVEERLERVGIGGVAGLGALGLGHRELVEEHDLQLLGRAEVDLLADDVVGVGRGGAHLVVELGLEPLEVVDVDRDADLLHPHQRGDERELDLAQEAGAAVLLDRTVECSGQVEDRPCREHRRVAGRRVVEGVEAELVDVGRVLAQLSLEVAQGQVGQGVGTLVGLDEIGGEGGVDLEAGQLPSAGGEREARAVGVVEDLGATRVREPRSERRVVLGTDVGHVDPGGVSRRRRDGDREHLSRPRTPGAGDGDPDPLAGRRVLVQPG